MKIDEYEMFTYLDCGYYRHLLFRKPSAAEEGFQLVTWPGALCITGRMGTYVFRQLPDMFEFFRGDGINPSYWAEKVEAADVSCGIKRYSPERAVKVLEDWIECDDEETHPGLRKIVGAMAGKYAERGEDAFRAMIDVFEFGGFTFNDFWEADLTEFDEHYLWCCEAVALGVRMYDGSKQ